MHRRTILTGVGNSVVGLAITSATVGAERDGEKPSPFVPSEAISPGPFGPQTVSAGEWITYEFYWAGPKESAPGCAQIDEEVNEIREWKVGLADRTLEYGEAIEYWSDCQAFDYGDAEYRGKKWSYTTKPLPPGEYDLFIEIRFTEDTVFCRRGGCEEFKEGDIRYLPNTLTVERGNRGSICRR